ncbi:MAG: ankyrin repeat domain-containing protein [Spirochaetaceae bacterium]|jgi:hypothetical protein|nr:ankyrin repeat domain-containing protein [Spirochaetaceae bacterium]
MRNIVIGVRVVAAALLLSGCASEKNTGAEAVKRNTAAFERAMAANDFEAMTRLAAAHAGRMNAVECMGDAINPDWTPGFNARHTIRVLELLIKHGGDVNGRVSMGPRDTWYSTPLLRPALLLRRLDVARFLLEQGADPNASALLLGERESYHPILALFAGEGELESVRFLVENGADIEISDNRKRTALWLAADRNRFEVARFLVENGADVRTRDSENKTPADAAREKGHTRVYDYLKAQPPAVLNSIL